MQHLLQGRGSLITKLALLGLLALGLVPSGCAQGGVVEGVVRYKYVTGMQDLRYYIIVANEPADGQPAIVLDKSAPEEVCERFPAEGNLVIDDATLAAIEGHYDRLYYMVSIHITSGSHYYEQAYRTERWIFNEMQLDESVRVDTAASDIGPKILGFAE